MIIDRINEWMSLFGNYVSDTLRLAGALFM